MISLGQHRYIDVDGVRTHYVVAGQGPPVVFIHGLGASMVAWRENIVPLSERLSVYALDLAGHGDSEKPNVEYSISFGVRYMLHFLDALDLQQVALVGNSMGGTLALATALEHAERVNRLVLVDTASLGREVAFYLRVASLPMVGELFNRPWFGINRKALRSVFNDMQFITKDLQEELKRVRDLPGARQAELKIVREGMNLLGMRPHATFLDRLPELQMPLMLVWGARDGVIPVTHAYAAAERLPSARLVVYEDCGHWPQMERAADFNRELTDFLTADTPSCGKAEGP